jgi:hypothetical protein
VIDLAQSGPGVIATGGSRGRPLLALAASLAVLIAGSVTCVVVTLRYLHAPALNNPGGGYGWMPPDDQATRFVRLGQYVGLVTRSRPGQSQSFYVAIGNDSSVTQTVLGLDESGTGPAQRDHVAISTNADYRISEDELTYRPTPAAVPPHTTRYLRFTFDMPKCPGPSPQSWDGLRLRVRVGAVTRTETVTFSTTIFELSPPPSSC